MGILCCHGCGEIKLDQFYLVKQQNKKKKVVFVQFSISKGYVDFFHKSSEC